MGMPLVDESKRNIGTPTTIMLADLQEYVLIYIRDIYLDIWVTLGTYVNLNVLLRFLMIQ